MHATDQTLQDLAARVGVGDHAAFRSLYATLAPETLAAVRTALPDVTHSMNVVRATFCEVWWMCTFDVRCGTSPHNLPKWIETIAARRGVERRQALDLIAGEIPPTAQAAFWTGLLADHDQLAHFELAAMLDGHDTIGASRTVRR